MMPMNAMPCFYANFKVRDVTIAKQENFNKKVENHLMENSRAIDKLHDIIERTSNDVKMVVKHFQMVQTQIDQLTKVQKDLLVNAFKEKQACEITTRRGTSTQDPLYPEGHSKRIEQDSERAQKDSTSFKKKKHKTNRESSEYARNLIMCLSLMLKLKVEVRKKMFLKKKELKRNLRGLIKMQNILRRISLLGNMVMRENLGYKNQCLFLIRNSIQRKENIITNSVSG